MPNLPTSPLSPPALPVWEAMSAAALITLAVIASSINPFGSAAPKDAGKGPTGFGAEPSAVPASADELVDVRLASASDALVPGADNTLAIVFDIEPEWYLYWKNPGEAGAEMRWSFEGVPAGVTIGEPRWPAPKRYLAAEDVVNYIYRDRVAILLPVRVDESAMMQGSVTLKASIEWMVCKELCLFGSGEASITLPVRLSGARATDDAGLIERTERAVPRPLVGAADEPVVRTRVDGSTLVIEAPGSRLIEFFPDRLGVPAAFVDQAADTRAGEGRRLRVRFTDEAAPSIERVTGVLRLVLDEPDLGRAGKGAREEFVRIDVPGPGAQSR